MAHHRSQLAERAGIEVLTALAKNRANEPVVLDKIAVLLNDSSPALRVAAFEILNHIVRRGGETIAIEEREKIIHRISFYKQNPEYEEDEIRSRRNFVGNMAIHRLTSSWDSE